MTVNRRPRETRPAEDDPEAMRLEATLRCIGLLRLRTKVARWLLAPSRGGVVVAGDGESRLARIEDSLL